MSNTILPDYHTNHHGEDDYKTPHEALSAKLHQMADIANMALRSNPSDKELYHLLWALADLLQLACTQCDELRPSDLMSDVQLADNACNKS